jgi:two-component sensor histidine kinase/PAS domain-containing protein
MSRRPHAPRSTRCDYTPDIDQLAALLLRWQGVAPTPPSLTEAVEELSTTMEELDAMNEDLTSSQQAAIESQQRYQELFEGVPEAYLVTNVHGLIQEANRPAAHLFNINRAHLTGLPLAVFVASEMRTAFRAQLAWLQNGAEVRDWMIRVQPRHQPPVSVVCHVAPALDTEGALIGLRWLLWDLKAQPQWQKTVEPRGRDWTAELARANEALQVKLDQAALRARAVHHQMNNNLHVLSSLLEWRMGDLDDPRMRAIVQECQGRIRVMALIHEHLHRADDPERLELGAYLRRLALLLFEAHGINRERIPLTVQAEAVEVTVQTALACGLLVHEVLLNVLLHAFPGDRAGAITITLRVETPGQVTLTIRDTSMGVPADLDGDHGDLFGFHLVRALTEQLQGILFTRDRGTCVTLRFPI